MKPLKVVAGALVIAIMSGLTGFRAGLEYAEDTIVDGGKYVNGVSPMPAWSPLAFSPEYVLPGVQSPHRSAYNEGLGYCVVLIRAGEGEQEKCEQFRRGLRP